MGQYYREGIQPKEMEEVEYTHIDWEKDADDLNIINLFGKEKLEDIQHKISKATGLAFITVDYRGEPVTEATSFTAYCQKRRNSSQDVTYCKSSDAFGAIQAAVTKKPCVYFCPCGLLEVAIPIVIDGHYLGGFIGGQLRCQDAPFEVAHLGQVIRRKSDVTEQKEDQKDFDQIPLYSYENFQDVANLVFMIINLLTENEINRGVEKEQLKKQIEWLNQSRQKYKKESQIKTNLLEESRLKLNPYTLMDALATAAHFSIIEEAQNTHKYLTSLIEFLKQGLSKQELFVPIADELKEAKNYLELQQQKYGKDFEYVLNVPWQEIEQILMPSYILMPCVTYAVFFGCALAQETGKLEITVTLQKQQMTIQIQDNGPALNLEEKEKRFAVYKEDYEGHYIHLALKSARRKLEALFGSESGIDMETIAKKGSVCTIHYPIQNDERVE